MSNIKQYFKDIFRTTSVLFISFGLTIGFIAFAITYPTTPSGQTAGGKFQEYFDKIFTGSCPTGEAIAGYDTNKDPICITTGTGSSGGGGGTGWKNVALTDTNNFDVNCDYRVDLGDGNTSGAKYRNVTGISNGSILIGYNQVTGWIGDSISKNSKSATTGGRSVTSIDKKCGLGGGSGWEDVAFTDTNDFDTNCEYRIGNNLSYEYANIIRKNAIAFEVSTAQFALGRIDKNNKKKAYYVEDGDFDDVDGNRVSVVGNFSWNITGLEKRCGGTLSPGGDDKFGGMFTVNGPSVGGCGTKNPYTGACNCPSGYTSKMVGHFCASVTNIPGYGCYLYYCYK